jgi:signal transduction histidine kinase
MTDRTRAAALPGTSLSSARQTLALHALSQLNRQIAENPDFYSLVNLLLLTLCGQCATADAFAVIHDPRSSRQKLLPFAAGRFEECAEILSPGELRYLQERLAHGPRALQVADFTADNCPSEVLATLTSSETQLLLPLCRDRRAFGILGLGRRAGNAPYTAADVELATLMVEAVAPFMSTLSREYFDMFHSVRQGVLVFDSDDRLIRINATAKRILEESAGPGDETVPAYGTPLESVFAAPKFDGWVSQLRFGRSGVRGRLISGFVQRLPLGDRYYTGRVSNINLRENGQCDMLIVLEDVTEKTVNDQRLYELQRFAERGAMTSSIAHELNNQITMSLGGAELMQRQLCSGAIEKATATLGKLLGILNQMKRFTAGLTDQSRTKGQKTQANLNSIVLDLLAFIRVQRRFNRISIDLLLDPSLPSCLLDADQMSQLLLNMLYNAADAIEEANQVTGRIRIQTAAANGQIEMAVSDNGCGIADDVKSRLFAEQFTTKETGHGFGLMMCGKIVKDHDGEIQIQSEPGSGTTFHFTFPVVPARTPDAHGGAS